MSALPLSPGFADPVLDGQAAFHAVMNALARPGSIQTLDATLDPPAPLTPELAAIALALVDHETTLWLDTTLAGSASVADYFRFHTGVRIVSEPSEAAFALVVDPTDMPPLDAFALGTDDYPDRSTTIVLAVDLLSSLTQHGGDEQERPGRSTTLSLRGPGIETANRLKVASWPTSLTAQRAANRALFPCGVDLIVTAPGVVAALPRTTELSEG